MKRIHTFYGIIWYNHVLKQLVLVFPNDLHGNKMVLWMSLDLSIWGAIKCYSILDHYQTKYLSINLLGSTCNVDTFPLTDDLLKDQSNLGKYRFCFKSKCLSCE